MLDSESSEMPDCFGSFSEKDIQCQNCDKRSGCTNFTRKLSVVRKER